MLFSKVFTEFYLGLIREICGDQIRRVLNLCRFGSNLSFRLEQTRLMLFWIVF